MNMLGFSLLLLYVINMSCNAHTGTHFVYQNRVYMSYSSWLLTFDFDLRPYRTHMKALKDQIDAFKTSFENIALDELPNNSSAHVFKMQILQQDILYLLTRESAQFDLEYTKLKRFFEALGHITSDDGQYRTKRSLLPFVGTILSGLFGLTSEADMSSIRRNLNALKNSQKQVLHVVEDSITLIDKTQQDVQINRNAINQLVNATTLINRKLTVLYNDVTKVLNPELEYIQLSSRVANVFHVVSSSLRATSFALQQLFNQVVQALYSTLSPSLAPPKLLSRILQNVEQRLPSGLALPFHISQIRSFYKSLVTTILPGTGGFQVVTVLPIVHSQSVYEIYTTATVPVPQLQYKLAANYKLEARHFAISQDRSKYILLSEKEYEHCKVSKMAYCSVKSPSFSVKGAPTCVIALFLKDSALIDQVCTKQLFNASKVPSIVPLFGSKWLISTYDLFRLDVTCDDDSGSPRTTSLTVNPGVQIADVGQDCSAHSDYFQIPKRKSDQIDAQISDYFDDDVKLTLKLPDIWDNSQSDMSKLFDMNSTGLPQPLLPVHNLKLNELHNRLKDTESYIDGIKVDKPTDTFRIVVIVSVVITAATVILSVVGFVMYKRFIHRTHIKKYTPTSVDPEVPDVEIELSDINVSDTQVKESDEKVEGYLSLCK